MKAVQRIVDQDGSMPVRCGDKLPDFTRSMVVLMPGEAFTMKCQKRMASHSEPDSRAERGCEKKGRVQKVRRRRLP